MWKVSKLGMISLGKNGRMWIRTGGGFVITLEQNAVTFLPTRVSMPKGHPVALTASHRLPQLLHHVMIEKNDVEEERVVLWKVSKLGMISLGKNGRMWIRTGGGFVITLEQNAVTFLPTRVSMPKGHPVALTASHRPQRPLQHQLKLFNPLWGQRGPTSVLLVRLQHRMRRTVQSWHRPCSMSGRAQPAPKHN